MQALRDRDFKLDRPAAEKWRGWIYKLIKQTEFAKEPEYEAKWMRFRTTTNKTNHLKSKKGYPNQRKPLDICNLLVQNMHVLIFNNIYFILMFPDQSIIIKFYNFTIRR